MVNLKAIVVLSLLLLALSSQAESTEAFWSWARKPTMGWNSWDCFATTINEQQTLAQADVMAEKLAKHGWKLITVDIQWYEPQATGFNYRPNAELAMDQYGRLLPAPNRFPSAANNVGFKALAKEIHRRGLKFGIHLMRGIPRQAVRQKAPILGTCYTAADIADTNDTCPWNGDMFGVDMSKPGAQAYYNSVFKLIASWGVDFIKVDDLSRPYHKAEIEAIRKAIDQCGRKIVFSTSPGETPVAEGKHVSHFANQWRISDDFWDGWDQLLEQFERLHQWTPYRGDGHFPDADMLPLGVIAMGGRKTNFTPDEQVTLMTLWSIARSPLILGADLTKLDEATLALLTNDEVIAVNQNSSGNRQFLRTDLGCAWTATIPGSKDRYLAMFNMQSQPPFSMILSLPALGFKGKVKVRDLWARKDLGTFESMFSAKINTHGAGLYRLSPVKG